MKGSQMKSFEVTATVEIPLGCSYKYEVCKETGLLLVDRVLPSPIPYNYGFSPKTLYKDGDPIDVCILGLSPIQPLAQVRVSILGAILCDDNGETDDKLVGVVVGDNTYDWEVDWALSFAKDYLSTYKPGFKVLDYVGPEKAYKIYQWSKENYKGNI